MVDPTDNRPTDPQGRYSDPARDDRVPPSANQTVVRSGGGTSAFIVVAVLAAILIVLFLAFGNNAFFGQGSDTVLAPEGGDTLIAPDDTTTATPGPADTAPAAPGGGATDTAPAAPEGGASDTAPAAPEGGGTTAPAPGGNAPAAQ